MVNKWAAAGPDSKFKQPGAKPAGFWAGYWHGTISPFTFVIGLFKPGVRCYETNNNGAWYDLGFLLGVSGAFGGVHVKTQGKQPQVKEEEKAEEAYCYPEEETPRAPSD